MVELYPKQELGIDTGTIAVEAEGNSEQEMEQLKQKLKRLEQKIDYLEQNLKLKNKNLEQEIAKFSQTIEKFLKEAAKKEEKERKKENENFERIKWNLISIISGILIFLLGEKVIEEINKNKIIHSSTNETVLETGTDTTVEVAKGTETTTVGTAEEKVAVKASNVSNKAIEMVKQIQEVLKKAKKPEDIIVKKNENGTITIGVVEEKGTEAIKGTGILEQLKM